MKRAIFLILMNIYLYGWSNVENAQLIESLGDELWNCSEWISVADAPVVKGKVYNYKKSQRSADGANWFILKLQNEGNIASVKMMSTSLGIFDIYINGQLVGKEILKPGYTHPRKTKYSFTYDVTDLCISKKGMENVFAAQVTPGWWGDKIVTPDGNEGMIGEKCAFRSVIEIRYDDGTVKIYGTDTNTWKAGIVGKIKHAAIFDGEIYDDREKPGYECIDTMTTPEVNSEFTGKISPTHGAEIYYRDDLALDICNSYVYRDVVGDSEEFFGKVVIIDNSSVSERSVLQPGETLVVDFGQNCAAVPYFRFKAKKGTVLKCLPGEILNDGNGDKSRGMDGPEGSVHRKNLRTPDLGMSIEYIFAGNDDFVEYKPRNTYFGYRYLSIITDGLVYIDDIKSIPISSIREEHGALKTGNESINRLIENTRWSQRSNFLSVPTDCPQRNERLGWTADTHVFAETGSFFADTRLFFNKWLRDLRDSQYDSGAYPSVAPYGMFGNVAMRIGWADAGIIVPYIMWTHYGDCAILSDCWESMEKYMDHVCATKYDHDTLIDENLNYQNADWLSFESLETYRGDYKDGNGKIKAEVKEWWNYLSASYWLMDARMMYEMAEGIGGKDCKKYLDMIDNARKHVMSFFNEDGSFRNEILNTMQTPALFALKNDIVEGKQREQMIRRLRDNFAEHGNCLQTGFLGTSILMSTLTDNGMADIAYELLFQRKNPSWLYCVDNGATTIWEKWDSYTKESGLANTGMNSFNHYAYGCVCTWIWNTCAGIASDKDNPGFKRIIMSPIPDRRLRYLESRYRSPNGDIISSWKYEGEDWIWNFSIPEGATASVTVPGESEAKEYAPGHYTIKRSASTSEIPSVNYYSGETLENDCFKTEHDRDIYVMDINGKLISHIFGRRFDLSTFPKGIYIIKAGNNIYKVVK